nr:hypothetical protein [Tanacetum cinerariifolium]GEZ01368.1 hypothetical protein [Tanacetum cinerariifolium]
MGYYFYFLQENKIVVVRYAKFFEKNLKTQEVSRRAIDLKEVQDEDTSPSEITSEIPMEVEGFEPPQEEVIPIRSYKSAMLDSKSNKWIDAMNAEIQSTMDNMVWVLVDLPPYCKTVGSKWIFKKKTDMDEKYAGFKDPFMVLSKHQEARIKDLMRESKVRCTRPDVAFAQNITSRFQQNPGELHWTAVKNILKYLRNTKAMFLVYGENPEAKLRVDCYCDAGFEIDRDDTKSQKGYVFILNGGAVDSKSFKQSTTAMSAIEAEYIAASEAAMEAVWIRKFISLLRGARHYHSRYHYVRESIALGEIRFLKVHTDDNMDDPFMKALSNTKLTQHARSMGLRLASSFMQICV